MSMTDDEYRENQEAYNEAMAWIDSLKPPPFLEWWRVENTGWSNGRSWFTSGGTDANPYRAKSEAEAIEYITNNRWDDPAVKWRYVHVTLQREDNKSITTEIWTEV